MKKLLIIPALAILVGCGGGGGGSVDNFNLTNAISGKTFYEASECKEPNFYSHVLSKDGYTQISYNDNNFNDKVYTKEYSIKTFSKEDIILIKDNIEYTCEADYEYDADTKKVSQLGLNCTNEDPNSEDVFFVAAYPTKELAIKNKITDCD